MSALFAYLKFYLSPILLIALGVGVYVDGVPGLIILLSVVAFITIGELFFGDDLSIPKYRFPFLLDLAVFINVPLFFIVLYLFLTRVSNGFELYHLFYIPIIGLQMALSWINVGHELVHRKSKKFDCEVGNWALAGSWLPAFAIEHIYGHHKNIGVVSEDPVTASAGDNPLKFAVTAFFKEHIHAWGIETRQLKRKNRAIFSFRNRILVGYLRTVIVFCLVGYFFNWVGMVTYLALGVVANYIFQLTNFIEHYGLVRAKGTPVQYHHSWNSNNRMTSYLTYNLTRHSDHHVNSRKEFWELNPCLDSGISLPSGYLTYILLFTFFPSYAKSKMYPRLKNWHLNYASQDEKKMTTRYIDFA